MGSPSPPRTLCHGILVYYIYTLVDFDLSAWLMASSYDWLPVFVFVSHTLKRIFVLLRAPLHFLLVHNKRTPIFKNTTRVYVCGIHASNHLFSRFVKYSIVVYFALQFYPPSYAQRCTILCRPTYIMKQENSLLAGEKVHKSFCRRRVKLGLQVNYCTVCLRQRILHRLLVKFLRFTLRRLRHHRRWRFS
jgi:hypothetical protein